ncbi:MAG: hypothetical protein J0M20_04770, partial [Burkholderiales bacterium]|nr:hypothetical protein [Burkholderiales bacterium]
LLAYAGEAGACAPAWADEAWAAMAPSMQAARDGGLVSTALVNLALAQAHRALAQGEPLQALPALQEVAGFGHRLQDPFTGAEAVCRALLLTSLVMIRCGEAAQAQAPLLAVHTMLQRATPLADPDRLADYEAYRKVVQLAIAAVNLRRTVGHDQARLPAVCRRVAEMAVHLFGAPRDRFMASIGLAGVDGTPEVRRVA